MIDFETFTEDLITNAKRDAAWALHQATETLTFVRKNHVKDSPLSKEKAKHICTLLTTIDRSLRVMKKLP